MALQDSDFDFLFNVIKDSSGIFLTKDKLYLIESRLTPVAEKHGLKDVSEFVQLYRNNSSPALLEEIVEAMTTNESLFFRDQKPFDRLTDQIIPRVLSKCPDKRHIKIWSAACSTGQEPYSISMTIMEEPSLSSLTFEILATDLDNKVIAKAEAGKYSQFEVQRGVPINYLIKYFTQEGEDWLVKDVLKQRIRYKKLNLIEPGGFNDKFDIIFCRNVLIYFDQETKNKILLNLQKSLESHGALVLGASENIMSLQDCQISSIEEIDGKPAPGIFVFKDL